MHDSITQKSFATTIASGQSLSDQVAIGALVPIGIVLPGAWTAADLSFAVSHDDGITFSPLFDMAAEVTASAAAASRYIALDPAKFVGINHLKIRSGTSGSPVNQAADRALILIGKI